MTEARLAWVPGPNEEYRLSMPGSILKGLSFIRRPITTPAKEGTIGFLDGLDDKGRAVRAVATFKDGEWRGGKGGGTLPFKPLVWTVCAEMERAADAG